MDSQRRNSSMISRSARAAGFLTAVLALNAFSGLLHPAYAQGQLTKGQAGRGTLSASDPTLDDDSHYDVWTYQAQAGERLRITLRSSDFDAYLTVGTMDGDEFSSMETDDDGAGGTDAQVRMTIEESGVYHIRVNSLGAGEAGAYNLLVEDGPVSTPAVSLGRLQLGTRVSGELSDSDPLLDDDSHYDLWTYQGQAGETIRAILRSEDFDAYVSIGQMNGDDYLALGSDDDGAGGSDARLTVTLGSDGEYVVRVNSLSEGETGDYTLLLEAGDPGEVAVEDQDHDDDDGPADPLPEPVIIRAGQTLNGELAESDPRMDDNSRYDLFSFTGRRGQQVTVTMRSTAFDSYLAVGRVEGGSFSALESDDDSGGNDDAQVVYRIPRDGTFVIRANSLFASVTGPYTIRLETGEAPPLAPLSVGAIRYGQTVTGELSASDPQMDDDSHYDLWKFTGRSGERIVITMKSGAFDTYVALGRLEGEAFSQIESDDDGAGGTDSKLEYQLESDGEYVIRANSLFSKGMGAYTLNLARNR